jgi:hypothetical protein
VTDAATTQILQGSLGRKIGTVGFNCSDQGDRQRLFNLAPLIVPERRFSRVFKSHGELRGFTKFVPTMKLNLAGDRLTRTRVAVSVGVLLVFNRISGWGA